jgi:hypothetical protein
MGLRRPGGVPELKIRMRSTKCVRVILRDRRPYAGSFDHPRLSSCDAVLPRATQESPCF